MEAYSSRGPSPTGGQITPKVSAPGRDIISAGISNSSTEYVGKSGTSMACPHVAGVVALLISANPTWKYDNFLTALARTADRLTITSKDLSCGNITTPIYPNNACGYGRVNAKRALEL
ncbi:minor extracellular protease vpr [Folsomia candida]|uniref:Subtilisin-like serine protease n=1 Tax=Folsomia candida TaxID=158441 RepID=A0A226D0H7_FOLCA|nr:minor extracellular protease vpr [Folsomia candida]OXA39095.1 Subtilisin-like serine protease [Folsomia candida]